jgi:hypothetical protein
MSLQRHLLILSCACIALAGATSAQSLGQNSLLTLMPELRLMAAPDWLHEGTRVTYTNATATVPGSDIAWFKGQADNWQKADVSGASSAGWVQYQCVYRSPTGAVGSLDGYLLDINTGNLIPHALGGEVAPAGAGACWANPTALAKADRFQDKQMHVIKMPQPIGDHTYKGIRFHYTTDTSVDDTVYDLDSGLMLFFQHIALTADRTSTLMIQMTFSALRQVPPVVDDAPAPDWLSDKTPLQYSGAITAYIAGSPPLPIPLQMQMQKTDGGARWGKYQATQQTQGQMSGSAETFCGAGGLCGEPWMAPALLQNLQVGQVLDRDPQLNITTSVEQVLPMTNGGELVVIAQEGKGFKRVHGYERATGKMLLVDTAQEMGVALQETRVDLVR